ncbi:MAG: response regulator [Opitutaceae bacterium]
MTKPTRVLHLEDSKYDAELIQHILEKNGVECEIVRTETREAFETALESGEFDIILSDNSLPGYDGASALRLVRERRPLVPTIIISGSLGEEEAVACLQLGAVDYLLKGRLERLAPAFKRAIAEAKERRRRKEAEAELRRNEERMRLALAATNDAIWDWDLVAGTMVCNETFLELFGSPNETENPKNWWFEHTHPSEREVVLASLTASLTSGQEIWQRSHKLLRRNGEWAHVENRAYLAKSPAGEVTRFVGAIQNITTRVALENERRLLEEQLRQAQKMEAMGTLAGGIAHDFNNILGIILMSAEVARGQFAEDPRDAVIPETLGDILAATNRAMGLVRQILAFSRKSGSEMGLIKIQPVVRECLSLLRTSLPAMVSIHDQIDPGTSPIEGNATQIHQVVMNICTNAWHALPDRGGVIEVVVDECSPGPDLLARHPEMDADRYVRIMISDNGHGIDPRIQKRIFEPFFTTKPPGKGTGLGLAVVHGIVQSHEGVLTLDSSPGKGTTFGIYIPAKEATVEAATAAPPGVPRGSGQRVLVVDDDPGLARALQQTLKQHGYRARACHHPELALDLVRSSPASIDLVVTDLDMPSMSGRDLARSISRITSRLPVLLLAGSVPGQTEPDAPTPGVAGTLAKPVHPSVLVTEVARVLACLQQSQSSGAAAPDAG